MLRALQIKTLASDSGTTPTFSSGRFDFPVPSNVFSFFNGASAYAYCVFCLFSAPCFGAIGAMRKELGSAKRMWQAVVFQTAIAWILAVIVFNCGKAKILLSISIFAFKALITVINKGTKENIVQTVIQKIINIINNYLH